MPELRKNSLNEILVCMVIRKAQLVRMGEVTFMHFIKQVTADIIKDNREWEEKETIEAKEKLVEDILKYGQKHSITTRRNLIKFVRCFVNNKFAIPLPQEFEMILNQHDVNEEERTEIFYIQMNSGRQKLKLIEI